MTLCTIVLVCGDRILRTFYCNQQTTMNSKMLRSVTIHHNNWSSRAATDVSDVVMSVEMMLLAGGVIGPFTRFVIGECALGILAIRVDTLTEVRISMVAVVDITLGDIEAALWATDVWTGTMIEMDVPIVT